MNLQKFKSHLSKKEDPSYYSMGLFRAIEAAHNECLSNQVDWTSFTLEDAEKALDHAMGYEGYDNLDEFSGHPNRENAIHQFFHMMETMSNIKHSSPICNISNDVHFF